MSLVARAQNHKSINKDVAVTLPLSAAMPRLWVHVPLQAILIILPCRFPLSVVWFSPDCIAWAWVWPWLMADRRRFGCDFFIRFHFHSHSFLSHNWRANEMGRVRECFQPYSESTPRLSPVLMLCKYPWPGRAHLMGEVSASQFKSYYNHYPCRLTCQASFDMFIYQFNTSGDNNNHNSTFFTI